MSVASDHGGIRVIAPITGSPYQYQVYYNDGYTHYSDAAGNEVGPGASGGGIPVQQAPGVIATAMATPASAGGSVGVNIPSGLTSLADGSTGNYDPPRYLGPPIFESGPPLSAALLLDQRSTTSLQSGDNPGPIPAVGVIAPQAAGAQPPEMNIAPSSKSNWKSLALVFAVLLGLWFFTGWSFARRLV